MRYDVCIIGGGIIGLCSAYYLQKEGKSVVILDKGPAHRASSHGNCGYLSPSHIIPLNDWGLIFKSLKWIFKEDAPFRIKPRLDFELFNWFRGFALNANKKHIHKAMQGRHKLLQSSKPLYEKMFEEEEIECEYSKNGVFFIYKEEKGFEEFSSVNEQLTAWGLDAKPYVQKALLEKEPAFKEDVYGGWLYETDAFLKPNILIEKLKKILLTRGVAFVNDFGVDKLEVIKGRIESVGNSQQLFEAKQFVVATGAWTKLFSKLLKLKIPVVPGKGYSITMEPPKNMLRHACIFEETKVAATPWKDTFRLGSLMEFTGFDDSINRIRLNALKVGAEPYLKTPYTDKVYEEWFGYRPMSMDGLPIIGKSPKHENLYIATGHGMLGLSMGTGTGRLVAEMLCQKPSHIDPSFYSIERYSTEE